RLNGAVLDHGVEFRGLVILAVAGVPGACLRIGVGHLGDQLDRLFEVVDPVVHRRAQHLQHRDGGLLVLLRKVRPGDHDVGELHDIGEVGVLGEFDELGHLLLDVVDHRVPDAGGVDLCGGEGGDDGGGVHGDLLDVLEAHAGVFEGELHDHVATGALGDGDLLPGEVRDGGEPRLCDDPVGLAHAVDGDDLGLAGGGQPHGAGADVSEVEVAGAQCLDLQRPVGEGLEVRFQPVLLPQALVVGDREQAGAVEVGDVAVGDLGRAGASRVAAGGEGGQGGDGGEAAEDGATGDAHEGSSFSGWADGGSA